MRESIHERRSRRPSAGSAVSVNGIELDCPAARDEIPDENDDRDDEQQVDEPGRHMEREEPERPQNEQDDGDSQKHERLPFFMKLNGAVTNQEGKRFRLMV